jgi:hypothetical protein
MSHFSFVAGWQSAAAAAGGAAAAEATAAVGGAPAERERSPPKGVERAALAGCDPLSGCVREADGCVFGEEDALGNAAHDEAALDAGELEPRPLLGALTAAAVPLSGTAADARPLCPAAAGEVPEEPCVVGVALRRAARSEVEVRCGGVARPVPVAPLLSEPPLELLRLPLEKLPQSDDRARAGVSRAGAMRDALAEDAGAGAGACCVRDGVARGVAVLEPLLSARESCCSRASRRADAAACAPLLRWCSPGQSRLVEGRAFPRALTAAIAHSGNRCSAKSEERNAASKQPVRMQGEKIR